MIKKIISYVLILAPIVIFYNVRANTYLQKIETLGPDIEQRIIGKSWQPACPIPLKDLRYVTMSYWGYDDQAHIGEMIVHKDIAQEVVEIFQELFEAKFPIERMQLIDDFFEPGKTNSEIDDISMTHNNTLAFFYRTIAQTNIVSEHGMGTAIDINPRVNPLVRGDSVSPAESKEYADRSRTGIKGFITQDGICAQAFIKRNWIWAGSWKKAQDYQHFCKVQKDSLR
jgi:hypothetical protein